MPSGVAAAAFNDPLQAAVSPPSGSHSGSFPITSAVYACVAIGGVPPLSYSWSRISTSVPGSSFEIESPNSQNTLFRMLGFGPGLQCIDVYECTVTDQRGDEAKATCEVTWNNTG